MTDWRTAFAALVMLAIPASPMFAQGAPTTGLAPALQGIGLTPTHKRMIYQEVGHEKIQAVPQDSNLSIGAEIPDSVMLSEMPISVKDRIGVLRDFKFARLPDENIVIVDPAKRTIVDVVTKNDAAE